MSRSTSSMRSSATKPSKKPKPVRAAPSKIAAAPPQLLPDDVVERCSGNVRQRQTLFRFADGHDSALVDAQRFPAVDGHEDRMIALARFDLDQGIFANDYGTVSQDM